ncbi:hypothetical protein BDV06DRAFT_58244 [Aspergillus oleicola]
MLCLCTTEVDLSVPYYPHQQFFRTSEKHFTWDFFVDAEGALKWPSLMKFVDPSIQSRKRQKEKGSIGMSKFPYGEVPFDLSLNYNKPLKHLVSSSEILETLNILSSLRFPHSELFLDIMDLASYDTARRRLSVAHSPFHSENKDALGKYLIYCWLTLVRYNMFAQALGINIDWKPR